MGKDYFFYRYFWTNGPKPVYLLIPTMRIKLIFVFFSCFSFICNGQVTLIGRTHLNNVELSQVAISVKVNGVITKTLNTQAKSGFKLIFEFGKTYDIYFQHPKCPVMYMQVIANTVPPEKYHYLMGYELKVPFVYKMDEDVDTTVYKNPFFKIYYDGAKSMAADTAYNTSFAHSVIKKHSREAFDINTIQIETATDLILAGKIFTQADPMFALANQAVILTGKNGETLRTGFTNKSGLFSFAGMSLSGVSKIKVMFHDTLTRGSLTILNTRGNLVSTAVSSKGACEWVLSRPDVEKLVDNNFTYTLGGKLVSASVKEKKFHAEKEVFLLNKYNTIVKKTVTSLSGTFIFEDIRPDMNYCIAIAKEGILRGEKIDLLSKGDVYLETLDSVVAGKLASCVAATNTKKFVELSVSESEMKMGIKATIFGDNINQPIGRLKIILLNDNYKAIDSAMTDDFGTFKFKYLPFLKRFFLSAENTDNILDVFKNILIYSEEENLIKIMTHQKGDKFSYKPVNAEFSSLREIELEDPWLELVDTRTSAESNIPGISKGNKLIVEKIMFEPGKFDITDQSKEILDKVILVLNANKDLKIEVGAHTDSKGSAAANLKLSELRAKTVVDYITRSAIGIERISAKGYGESQLLNHCLDAASCSETEHAQNRRIEFKILGEH